MASLRLNGQERRKLMTEPEGWIKLATSFNHPSYNPQCDYVVVRVPEDSKLLRINEDEDVRELIYHND